MRRLVLAIAVATIAIAPVAASAQQDPGAATGQKTEGQAMNTVGRLATIGIGAAALALGWTYLRPYVLDLIFPPPAPAAAGGFGMGVLGAISAFEAQQAASLGPAVAPVPYYEYVAAGLIGAIAGNFAYEVF